MTEFEFDSTPETDAMLKQICIKECFVRCKDCKYWYPNKNFMEDSIFYYCSKLGVDMDADDFCSRGEQKE